MTEAAAFQPIGEERMGPTRRMLAAIGRISRARAAFVLAVFALGFGVVRELARASSWRRSIRAEFARVLRQAVGGGLMTMMVAAALIGVSMVYQTLFWLGEAGQYGLVGSILVTVLVREVAPVIVGLILLGRSGTVVAAEIGALQLGGQIQALTAQGLDPFLLLVLPRAAALAVACYTLGIVFIMAALSTGILAASLAGGASMSTASFFATVLGAMRPTDFAIFPAKMLVIGLLIALVAVLTGLTARPGDDFGNLLPRTFVRGLLAIMLTSIILGLAV